MTIRPATESTCIIGDWTLNPVSGELWRGDTVIRLEDRTLRVLLCLAERPGEVFSVDDLLQQGWPGVIVTPDSLYQAIAALRRQLGDDPKQPRYIANVPRRGYRLIAPLQLAATPASAPEPVAANPAAQFTAEPIPPARPSLSRPAKPVLLAVALIVVAAGLALVALWPRHVAAGLAAATTSAPAVAPPRTVAVLPLLDLTDAMSEEPFADGMTEELIDKLSKVPGLAVSPPAASFYYKERRVSLAEFAHTLHVAFVLDGSVRKSGKTLRVAARLCRVSDGFVVWSETYDRSWHDKLMIQDDIANEVSKALTHSIR